LLSENSNIRIAQFSKKNVNIATTAGSKICGNVKSPVTPPAFSYNTPEIKTEITKLAALKAVLIGGLLKKCVKVFSPVLVGIMIKGVLIIIIAAEMTGP